MIDDLCDAREGQGLAELGYHGDPSLNQQDRLVSLFQLSRPVQPSTTILVGLQRRS